MEPEDMRIVRIRSHEKDAKALIAREFSASRMNKTKWMEVIRGLEDMLLRWRVKIVNEDEPTAWGGLFCPSFGYFEMGVCGPYRVFMIEWLEIGPYHPAGEFGRLVDCDHLAEVSDRLKSWSIPFDVQEGRVRITGYVR